MSLVRPSSAQQQIGRSQGVASEIVLHREDQSYGHPGKGCVPRYSSRSRERQKEKSCSEGLVINAGNMQRKPCRHFTPKNDDMIDIFLFQFGESAFFGLSHTQSESGGLDTSKDLPVLF